jgi:uncharacterized protein (DUF305 family)
MKPFALPLFVGITIGIITTGVITLARDDFYWYRNEYSANEVNTSIDATFIENMIPHHQDAVDMAKLALEQAKTNEVKTLAQNIITNQQEEIIIMEAWYKTWFGAEVPDTETSGYGMMMSGRDMMGGGGMMNGQNDLSELTNAKDFDKAFVEQMIPHHEMAIMMAQMLLRTTSREEMRTLAQNIIDAQSKEAKDMLGWLEVWE